ncbi:MAG: GDP-mannose 4,6-dehydratase [Chloroflexi bacterium]|nr:GDP-mannose 4,6-dehydratase [Chloroflexota bacterium]
MNKTVLVTGAAGFIGSSVTQALLARGDSVVGMDDLNPYYSPKRKLANLTEVQSSAPDNQAFRFIQGDIRDRSLIGRLFAEHRFDSVVHIAGMPGIRDSITNPALYYDINLNGTLTLLDGAVRRLTPKGQTTDLPRFIFASTSSVYGATRRIPFVESDPCDMPLAPYPASKRAAELLGFTYHHLYHLPFTALRLFTVYGPRGRPDMMAYKLADSIFLGRNVPIYANGQMKRDWTYVDDIVRGIIAAVDLPMEYEIINLGRGESVLLADFVGLIEELTRRKANLTTAPMPDTDMPCTFADISKARRLLGYDPSVSVQQGIARFLAWYEEYVRNGNE